MEPFWVRAAWPCDTGRLRAAVTDWDSEGGDAGVRAELVTLVRPQTNTVETPCVLYLQCSTQQPADIVFVEVLSEARTMEVYTEGEYCGTSQGQRVESLQINGDHEQILLFRKYFKLDFPSSSCELKLLSLGGKEKVRIGKLLLGVKHTSVRISRGFSQLGKNINLERVQTMMDSMGAKLSPGAQQLFNMVQFQQKNQAAIGGLFQGIFGARDLIEVGNISSLPQSEEGVTSSNALSKPNPMSVSKLQETKDPGGITTFNAAFTQTGDGSVSPTETNNENKTSDSDESTKDVGEQKFARGDLKGLVSTFLSKQSNGEQNAFSSEMLPLLQDLCGQVNELRMGEKIKVTKNNAAAEDMSCGRHYQQAFCSELEKHIAEHMESVEKRLKDYIDCRINILQTNLDEKFVSLTNLLENIALNRTATKSFERDTILTNGEL
ncbi:ATPase PAAT isoform X1 [Scyliorhinus canicula]|uniref:ATPase PAAT isoform X1 n=2 Tax=Scyliorhinus canicula TaxID=7830 RepID=UPI0018F330CD|nr:ATPase PAAT isoform X1 [Scyliorhinus canicula]